MTVFTTFERLMSAGRNPRGIQFTFDGDVKSAPGRYKVCKVEGQNVICQRLDNPPVQPKSARDYLIRYFALSDPIAIEATLQEAQPS